MRMRRSQSCVKQISLQSIISNVINNKMNFEKLLGQQAFKNHKCNPFQSSSSCFERLFIFNVSPQCPSSRLIFQWIFGFKFLKKLQTFGHYFITVKVRWNYAFVAWRFCRTHYWAAKPQKRALLRFGFGSVSVSVLRFKFRANTMRNIRSGHILSLHSLLIGKVLRALFVLQIIHWNLLNLSVSYVRRDFLYLKVFSNSCLFKSR